MKNVTPLSSHIEEFEGWWSAAGWLGMMLPAYVFMDVDVYLCSWVCCWMLPGACGLSFG